MRGVTFRTSMWVANRVEVRYEGEGTIRYLTLEVPSSMIRRIYFVVEENLFVCE